MAKRKQHKPLTAHGVERMKAPAKGPNGEAMQVDIPDAGHPGLMLRQHQAQDPARNRMHVRLQRAELERSAARQHHPRGRQDSGL